MNIEHQIKAYTDQIETAQRPISAKDVLESIDVVHVNEDAPATPMAPPPWQRLVAIGAIAAAFVLIFGTSLWFTREILPGEDGAASASITIEATPLESLLRFDTPLGVWVWEPLDTPLSHVVEFEGTLLSVDSPMAFDSLGNPTNADEFDAPRRLLVSDDGTSWDPRPLPDEMQDMYLSLFERHGELFIAGQSGDSLADQMVWSTSDAVTWTQIPEGLEWNALGLSVPGVTTEGVAVRFRHDEPVRVGDTQLVKGSMWFQFPSTVTDRVFGTGNYEMSQSEGDKIRFQIWAIEELSETRPDQGPPDVEVVVDISESSPGGTVLEYMFYSGAESDGDLFHTARIDIDASLDVDSVTLDGSLHPWFPLLWRAEGNDDFEFAQIPVERAAQPQGFSLRLDHVAASDGSFVLYGGAPNGETTRVSDFVTRNEPSRVGVIATSSDGLRWTSTTVDGLINPQGIRTMADGTTLWTGEFATWISQDGLSGEVRERPPEWWITEGPNSTLMRPSESGLWLSPDGEEWISIAFPTNDGYESHGVGLVGDHLFFADGREGYTWVGNFEQ